MRSLFLIVFAFVLGCGLADVSRAQQQPAAVEFDNVLFDVRNVSQFGTNRITFTNQNSSLSFAVDCSPPIYNRWAGEPLNFNIVCSGDQAMRGNVSGVINGVNYSGLHFSGNLVFTPSETLVFPFKYNRQKFRRVVATTITGFLNIHDRSVSSQNTQIIARAQLNLSGTAVATLQFQSLTALPDGVPKPYYKIGGIRYALARAPQTAPENLLESSDSFEQNELSAEKPLLTKQFD